MRELLKIAAGVCAAAGIASAASAGTATANLGVSASIAATCTISTSAVAFGAYSGSAVDATGTITANCINGTAWTIALGTGASSGATTSLRKMTSGANTLPYQLFSDSGHTANWGNTSGEMVAGTGTGASQNQTVYGRIPAATGPIPSARNYSDTVVATINF